MPNLPSQLLSTQKTTTMKLTVAQTNALMAPHSIKIVRYRSKFSKANWRVKVQTGRPTSYADGSRWDGWEDIGYFAEAKKAINAAVSTAKDRNGGVL